MRIAMLALLFTGLTAGNFIWQATNDELWMVALERTFFQGLALFAAAFVTAET